MWLEDVASSFVAVKFGYYLRNGVTVIISLLAPWSLVACHLLRDPPQHQLISTC